MTDEERIEQMRLESARLSGRALPNPDIPNTLPIDPTLGTTATALLEKGVGPVEFLSMVMWGVITDATSEQINSAKSLLPYLAKAQATKQQVELSGDALTVATRAALRTFSDAELDALDTAAEAAMSARH